MSGFPSCMPAAPRCRRWRRGGFGKGRPDPRQGLREHHRRTLKGSDSIMSRKKQQPSTAFRCRGAKAGLPCEIELQNDSDRAGVVPNEELQIECAELPRCLLLNAYASVVDLTCRQRRWGKRVSRVIGTTVRRGGVRANSYPLSPMMERAQPQSPLFAVPPEVHGIVVSYVGRSAAQPSCSPAELFRACRDLHALGRDTSVRIGWLLAVFGARMVGDGMGGFLALLTREVVEGVFRRVGQVPRYQLQRLFRRFSNAGRTDLLLPVLQYADEMYPPPSHELVAGPKAFPPIGLGFNPSLPDEDLFKKLLKEGVTEETAYLVAEGKAGGFAEKGDDDVMTALLTLREKYLFDVNHTIPGRSPSSGRILFRGQERPAYYSSYSLDRGTGGFTTDVGIEGTNGGHVALVEAIHNAREASVRRLLQLGVSVHAASGSLFWEAVEEARAAIAAENAEVDTAALERSGIYNAAGRAAEHLVTKILNVPMDVFSGRNVHDYMGHTANAAQLKGVVPTNNGIVSALCRAYGATMPYNDYQYFRDTVKGDCTDALQVAVCKSGGGDAVLRILLESKQDEGWFQTDAGKQSLETCIQLCLKVDRLDLMDLLQQYSRLNSKDAMIVDLVSALCAQDREAALKLINEGWTLSEAEAVSLLRSRNLAEAHSIILEHVKFQPSQITSILTNLIRGSYNERQRMMATIARVLTAYKDVWSADGEPRQWMMKAFEDSQFEWVRPTMRPFLGPSSSSFSAAVLRYDLREAVTKDDVKELKKLAKLGAKLPTYMVLQYIGRYTTARTETLLALIDACSFSASELSEILAGAITRDDQVVESLLDEKRKIRPLVTYQCLRECMMRSKNKFVGVFERLMRAAAQQSVPIDKHNLARRMAISRGGRWEAAWLAYEDADED